MSPRSKKEQVEPIFLRYKKAFCKKRTLILDEFCATCGYHRACDPITPKIQTLRNPQSEKVWTIPGLSPKQPPQTP